MKHFVVKTFAGVDIKSILTILGNLKQVCQMSSWTFVFVYLDIKYDIVVLDSISRHLL